MTILQNICRTDNTKAQNLNFLKKFKTADILKIY